MVESAVIQIRHPDSALSERSWQSRGPVDEVIDLITSTRSIEL